MTKPIDSLRMDIINSISAINDYAKLAELAEFADIIRKNTSSEKRSIFDVGSTKVVSIPTFDDLYSSQGSKTILFEDLPEVDDDWGFSLEELLIAL